LRRSGRLWAALPLVFAVAAEAGQARTIELVDGSVIRGEILSVDNGVYRIGTERLGTVILKDEDIAAIRATPASPSGPGASVPSSAGEAAALQKQIAGNPQWMQSVTTLKDDPDLQQILKDPVLMQAIREGNLEALQSDPRIQRLMSHPVVQDLQRQLGP
jgi:hypothetical protein